MHNNYAPIVLFVYNRPDHTEKTLNALSKNRLAFESTLIIYCDGPKPSTSKEDVDAIELVKKVVRSFNWPGVKRIICREVNFGLAKSIMNGVSEVLDEFGKVIVLEDDIVTSDGFLEYMNAALNLYESSDKVMHISGYWFPTKNFKNLPETFFYQVPSCWGWGTWSRAWSSLILDPGSILKSLEENNSLDDFEIGGNSGFLDQLERNANGTVETWAILWYGSVYLNNGLCLHPSYSLVNNIGHDESGTNSKTNSSFSWSELSSKQKIVVQEFMLNPKAKREMQIFYSKESRVKRALKYLWNLSLSKIYSTIKPRIGTNEISHYPKWETIKSGYGKGIKLFLDIPAFSGWHSMIMGDYDAFMFEELVDERPKVIFDIGSHFGYNAMIFSEIFKDSRVLAFEPNPHNYELLIKNVEENRMHNIDCYPVAVGDTEGRIVMKISDDVAGSQSTGSHIEGIQTPLSESHYSTFIRQEVDQTTLDSFSKSNSTVPDIIKIDVEGFEAFVLRGAVDILRNHHPILLIEVHSVFAMYECSHFLTQLGYQIMILDKENMTASRCFISCRYSLE
ncbi:MAG: FkbM family methyltransferase [Parvicella sp.]|jgi:FkbM family methyltransferase